MRHIKILGLSMLALFAVNVMATSSASAELAWGLHYLVGGHKLEAGETRLLLARIAAGTEFVLTGKVAGANTIVKCTALKLNQTDDPVIVGGLPGTGERQLIEFENCSGTIAGAPCSEVIVHNTLTSSELVMIAKPVSLAGMTGVLFKPASGNVFTTILLKECGIITAEGKVEGTTVALAGSENVDSLWNSLIWTSPEITEVEWHDGSKHVDGLKFAGSAATLRGTAEVRLESDELWGIL